MSVVKFYQGEYNEENLKKIKDQDGVKIEDIYILPDGGLYYLTGEENSFKVDKFVTPEQAEEIAKKVLEKLIQNYPKRDLKNRFENPFKVIDLIEELGL